MAVTLAEVNLCDPDAFVPGVPHEAFRLLRREAPVFWHPDPDGPGFWAVTRHADVCQVSHDAATFSSHERSALMREPAPEDLDSMRLMMLNQDPPRHTRLRKLVNKGFTPRMVSRLEPRIRQATNEILDRVAPKGSCDFVTEVSADLPLIVIAELLGVPIEDRTKVFGWSNRLIGFDDPEYRTSMDDAQVASMEIYEYANQLAQARRADPGDDLVSVLLEGEIDGEHLTELEFDLFFLLLSVAGNETTRNAISGGLLALMEHRGEWERLKSEPSLFPTATEEIVRWVSPVMHFRRTCMADTEIRGQEIKAGDKVVVWYISANRDEDVFGESDRFDVGREPNDHIGFGGGGPHFCLGANLARLEIRVLFEELVRRLPDIELDGEVRRLRSNFINGIKEMPVRFTPEEAA